MLARCRSLALLTALAFSVGLVALVAAEDPASATRVELDVTPREATIGDSLAATLAITLPPEVTLAGEPLPSQLGPFEVRQGSWQSPVPVEGGRRWIWQGVLVAFETGALTLPSIELRLDGPDDPDEPGDVLRSEPLEIRIVSVLDAEADAGPEAELDGLRPPASLEPDYAPLWAAAGLLLVALVVLTVAWWLQRRLAARLAAVPVPDDPFHRMAPHDWALDRLGRLRERALDDEPARRVTIDELSAVLKRYLGGRYRVELLERTTGEVRPALEPCGASPGAIEESVRLLERCDAVKFAGVEPDADAVRAAIDAAIAIVERTRPRQDPAAHDASARGAA